MISTISEQIGWVKPNYTGWHLHLLLFGCPFASRAGKGHLNMHSLLMYVYFVASNGSWILDTSPYVDRFRMILLYEHPTPIWSPVISMFLGELATTSTGITYPNIISQYPTTIPFIRLSSSFTPWFSCLTFWNIPVHTITMTWCPLCPTNVLITIIPTLLKKIIIIIITIIMHNV